ncbi:MAG: hypothetical protein K6C06_05295 [Lachnospiraceae bacterium]|nr:hypothetical protein [Lachnospiraceae bacterium]
MAASDPDAVSIARENTYSGGKFVKSGKNLIYRIGGTQLKDTWAWIGGNAYRFNASGYVQKGSFTWNGFSYLADSRGRLYVNVLCKSKAGSSFYKKTGARAKNEWIVYKGREYYMNARGYLARNTWVGDFYVGSNGLKKRNCWVGRQYLDSNGLRAEKATEKTVRSTATEKEIKNGSKLIIVGASRVVQMGVAVTGDGAAVYIARYGAGYSWFASTGMTALTGYLKVYPKSKVVIQLGNNDMENFSRYASAYRRLIDEYPDASFYFMDALPSANKSKNAKRQAFNAKLKAAFSKQYIGGYDYLSKIRIGYKSKKDKEHYNKATYKKIYRYITSKIR